MACDREYLFAEVVRTIAEREVCWIRPIALAVFAQENWQGEPEALYDLRQGADLVWPVALFREAFDTEVLLLLERLGPGKPFADDDKEAKQRLYRFACQVWQAHPADFARLKR